MLLHGRVWRTPVEGDRTEVGWARLRADEAEHILRVAEGTRSTGQGESINTVGAERLQGVLVDDVWVGPMRRPLLIIFSIVFVVHRVIIFVHAIALKLIGELQKPFTAARIIAVLPELTLFPGM